MASRPYGRASIPISSLVTNDDNLDSVYENKPSTSAEDGQFGDEDDDNDDDELPEYDDFRDDLASSLTLLHKQGSFAWLSPQAEAPIPGLVIDGLGAIGLPPSAREAKAVITQCQQSPFGKGEHTFVDEAVRKSWELNANQFSFRNPVWPGFVNRQLAHVHEALGLPGRSENIRAEQYKLLLYEEGAFFKPHQDSEKTTGMFGTMVIALPSKHEGGSVKLSHNGKEMIYNSASSSEFGTSCAAWYGDILHEVLPVTSGYRFVVTYNLIQVGALEISKAPKSNWSDTIKTHLQRYDRAVMEDIHGYPAYLIHKLEHPYTSAGLKLESLKGADFAQVRCLRDVGEELGFGIYLAATEKTLHKDDDAGSEVFDREEEFKWLTTLDGVKCPYQPEAYEKENFLDPAETDDEDHDESEHEGWTGNEGAPAQYWYRSSVVVLVPSSKKIEFALSGKDIVAAALTIYDDVERQAQSREPLAVANLYAFCSKVLPTGGADFGPARPRYGSYHSYGPYYGYRSYGDQQSDAAALSVKHSAIAKRLAITTLNHNWTDLYERIPLDYRLDEDLLIPLGKHIAANGAGRWTANLDNLLSARKSFVDKWNLVVRLWNACIENNPAEEYKRSLQIWVEAILNQLVEMKTSLTKVDASALADLIQATWPFDFDVGRQLIEKVLREGTPTLVEFVLHLSSGQGRLSDDDKASYVTTVLKEVWSNFIFSHTTSALQQKPAQASSHYLFAHQQVAAAPARDEIDIDELKAILQLTQCHDAVPMAVALRALQDALLIMTTADTDYLRTTIVPFIGAILQRKIAPLAVNLAEDTDQALKSFVCTALCVYINTYVGKQPSKEVNWTRPTRTCTCDDCRVVNEFMSSSRQELHFPAAQHRREHLHAVWTNPHDLTGYDVDTIRQGSPHVWHVVKNNKPQEARIKAWQARHNEAQNNLLAMSGPSRDVLQKFAGADADDILSCRVERLPRRHLARQALRPATSNTGNSNITGKKRPFAEDENMAPSLTKRLRANTSEVVDLTEA